ncbi:MULTISPECIES: trehalose-phosphatase [Kocuria]|uniref:Trehalose 6-phosphate phosphatase n=1 Tax=Kocuria subflava TaxID=1736139 RepID=A0A846TPZ1_9MICC|nr:MULTISPECIES: trehalose-phosphatase [Kocuria]NKE08990.1 trehalose-phosphatase [Kocuria subflava]
MTNPTDELPAPRVEDDALLEHLRRAAGAERLLVALDFDGTLAYFTEDIAASRAVDSAEAALETLAGLPNTWVAVISGRTMDFLHSAVDPHRRMLLSGSHGGEYDLSILGPEATSSGIELGSTQQTLLDQAVSATRDLVDRHPGAVAEYKPGGVAFHTRTLENPGDSDEALATMHAEFSALEGLRITPGEMVMECSVLTSDKGQAVTALINAVQPDVTLFAGDDVTDEHGLAVLGPDDLGIKVGPKDTVAPYRVADPDAMGAVLAQLAELRQG